MRLMDRKLSSYGQIAADLEGYPELLSRVAKNKAEVSAASARTKEMDSTMRASLLAAIDRVKDRHEVEGRTDLNDSDRAELLAPLEGVPQELAEASRRLAGMTEDANRNLEEANMITRHIASLSIWAPGPVVAAGS